MTVKLLLNAKTITIGDIIRAEQGFTSSLEMVEFLAHFVMNGDGKKMEFGEAKARIMDLPLADLPDLVAQVTEGVKALQAQAVPLATNGD